MKKNRVLLVKIAVLLFVFCSVFGVTTKSTYAASKKEKALTALGEYLEKNVYKYEYFSVVDLNKDGIPEVICEEDQYGWYEPTTLLVYNNGKVVKKALDMGYGYSSIYYNSKDKTYFINQTGGFEICYTGITLKNNKLNTQNSLSILFNDEYYFNGKEISLAQYKSYLNKYYGGCSNNDIYNIKAKAIKYSKNTVKNRFAKLNYIKKTTKHTTNESKNALKSGNYLYYSLPESNSNVGLMKLNLKTMKSTQLVKGTTSSGCNARVSDMQIKGGYIYFTLSETSGEYWKNYSYKVSTSGKNLTKLGTTKKSATTMGIDEIEKYNGKYYFVSGGKLYEANPKTKKVTTIASGFTNGMSFEMCGGYALITRYNSSYYGEYYAVNVKTKKKTLLKKWMLAE